MVDVSGLVWQTGNEFPSRLGCMLRAMLEKRQVANDTTKLSVKLWVTKVFVDFPWLPLCLVITFSTSC